MKYNVNSLEIKREEFDKIFEAAEDFDYETGLGKREIGKSKFLIVEDENTGAKVCYAIRNTNIKTANARFVINAKIDEEEKLAKVNFSRKAKGFELPLDDLSQDAFFTDLEYNTTGNEKLDALYNSLQTRPSFGIVSEEEDELVAPDPAAFETEREVEAEDPLENAQEIEIPTVATFMPVVMKVGKKASKSQFFAQNDSLYLIVCPDKNGELSVWLANDKIVSIDAESGNPKFERTDAGRPWERVLQENSDIVSDDVKKLSRAKSREFFRKGTVATIWQEAGNKGKEKVVLTASRKEIKEFLTQARNTYKESVEKEGGTVKNIKKVFKKAKYALTGFVAGAALTAIVLASGLTTGNIDKADAAKDFGKTQVKTATSVEVEANEAQENVVRGKLFNYVKDENGNVKVLDCMGLSEAASQSYKKYESGLGFVKYGFKQNSVYGNATLEGIGEELAEQAVAELSANGVVLTETDENNQTKTNVIYPVGNKTVEEAASEDNMVSFLVLNGMSEADAKVVARAYTESFEAGVSTTKPAEIPSHPTEVEVNEVDFSTDEVAEAISKAIESTKVANNDTADWKVEYASSEDQMIAVSTDDYLYIVDLAEREEGALTSAPIADQDDLLERLENARLDDRHVSFAFNANTLYGDEDLVKLVTDKFVSDNRQYKSARAYVGGIDVQTTENGTNLKQVNYMIAEQEDGKNAIVMYVANEVSAKNVSTEMIKLSAASFFAPVGFRNSNFVLLPSQNAEVTTMSTNAYQSPEAEDVEEKQEENTTEDVQEETNVEEEMTL